MRKTQKRVFGLLGLSLVAGMTAVAASIPGPEALAATQSSVTDTIQLRVVGDKPVVEFNASKMETATASPDYNIHLDYQQIDMLIVKIANSDDEERTISITRPDYNQDSLEFSAGINLDDYFGENAYDDYIITGVGTGINGGAEDSWKFTYYPTIIEQQTNGEYTVQVDDNDEIKRVEITFKGTREDGVEVNYGPVVVTEGTKLSDFDDILKNGNYTATVTAYDADENGDVIFRPFSISYTVTGVPATGAPDTGGLFKHLNISKEDYLTTGLLAFFVVAIVAFGVVFRGRKVTKTTKNAKRRR